MEIRCTVEELKELIQNKTPVATTTDEMKNNIPSHSFSNEPPNLNNF